MEDDEASAWFGSTQSAKPDATPRASVFWSVPRYPGSCGLTRAQIDAVAESWALRVPVRSGPSWVISAVGGLGGEIIHEPRAPLLIVASRRDQFCISSEVTWHAAVALGHLALHQPHVEPQAGALAVPVRAPPLGGLARARAEATWFAAAFLMPEHLVRRGWSAHNGDIVLFARELRVPAASLAARVLRLGLTST